MPLGALSAILIVVAYNMSELHHCKSYLQGNLPDKVIFTTTLLLTVFVDLTVAVPVGVLLSKIPLKLFDKTV